MANNFESSAKRFLNSPNIFGFEKDMWELTKKNRSSNSHDPRSIRIIGGACMILERRLSEAVRGIGGNIFSLTLNLVFIIYLCI